MNGIQNIAGMVARMNQKKSIITQHLLPKNFIGKYQTLYIKFIYTILYLLIILATKY